MGIECHREVISSSHNIRLAAAVALSAAVLVAGAPAPALAPAIAGAHLTSGHRSAPYLSDRVIVGYRARPSAAAAAALDRATGVRSTAFAPAATSRVVRLAPGDSVPRAIARLRSQRGVAYAVPDYIAHAAGEFIPDDVGNTHQRAGWEKLQWNFLAGAGVNAPGAWANLIAAGKPGGRGVTVAVLDTGVAYRNWRQYRASPDFTGVRFTAPYDFVAHNRYPLDHEGHGTFVAGTIAEATNNGLALTGLAYGATIMPVRVLDSTGYGDASAIARGIRYAVQHHAQVINLSLEFPPSIDAGDIPDILSAVRYAHDHGAVVVAASGNEASSHLAYPARSSSVISVGASTGDRCLASYSNSGSGLDLVAPGGGNDSIALASDSNCHPFVYGRPIDQMTLLNATSNPGRFGIAGDYYGTSMSSAHVAAIAALVIASGVIGSHPTADQVLARLKVTAQHLGRGWPNADYGFGLVDAAAATAPTPGR
jgi:serine protease